MCGIAGILSFNKADASITSSIQRMSKALKHRGPDDEGYLIVNKNQILPAAGKDTPASYLNRPLNYAPKQLITETEAELVLLHRRLSIIDLSITGHQPLCYNGLWIVFNGEIYNYIELKKELESHGCVFSSKTDTEVIVAAYSVWAEQCVNKFNGMWAFVIYDPFNNKIFASRDRLGVKPFYYYANTSYFIFASEQKAFFASGIIKREINDAAFIDYFVLDQYEQESEGIYKNIYELFPGYNLEVDLNKKTIVTSKYFSIKVNNEFQTINNEQLTNYKAQLKDALFNAVKLRLRSDVAVGSCLSGGIDSSSIVGIANKIQPNLTMQLFTACFNEPKLGEQHYAQLVAQQVNGKWNTVFPTFSNLSNDLYELIFSQDIPIWSTSTYAQFSVMKLAKQHNTKVLLDGQGSDELFGGYPVHYIPYLNELLKNKQWNLTFKLIQQNSISISGLIKRYFADFYLKYLSPDVQLKILRNIHPELIAIPQDLNMLILERIRFYQNHFFEKTPTLNQYLLYETYNHRLKSYLKCEDRASMWHSVEARTPFADDINLINLAFKIPGNYKIMNGQLKYLLRETVKDLIPPEVYFRSDKMGYNTPNDKWVAELYKQFSFFENQNHLLDTRLLKTNLPKLLNKNNPRLFKVFVSDIWLNL
jgi:asparagine synthase (glutamine-hydrolysing)